MVGLNVAIVGATGAVGEQMRLILESRRFPVKNLKLAASERSAGQKLKFNGRFIEVEKLTAETFNNVDLALFSAGADVSRQFAPLAKEKGAIVIDNSSAFRQEPDVPLVVPEVNRAELAKHKGIIANPNCSTIQMVVVLKPLHDLYELKRVVVSTYQAVSGTGRRAVVELLNQSKAFLAKQTVKASVYPKQIAFNVLPHIDVFQSNGYSKEEMKMILETRKIMQLPELKITATTVRVPVITGHSEAVNVEFKKPVSLEVAREALAQAPGVTVLDDPQNLIYPSPLEHAGQDSCFVGRLRVDESVSSGLNLWIVSDNLRKGAALNAIQIAECLITDKLLNLH